LNLEVFLKEVVGKPYGLTINKLLRKETTIFNSNRNYIDENRTFFCSELIAKAFKIL
jgi:hypothetical protein